MPNQEYVQMSIGLMGVGLMGLPMCQRFLDQGIALVVYNRTAAKLAPLQQTDAVIATTPQDVLQQCECVILMLTDAAAIAEVLLAEPTRSHLAGRTVIQMGTIAPQESSELQSQIVAAGGEYLEAPVLGSIPEAQTGQLLVMVGATSEHYQQWLPLLQVLGPEPVLLGSVGAASAAKLALNQLIGALTTGFAVSLGLVQQYGVEVEAFMQILRQSALYAPTFDKKLSRMLSGNYANPNFPTKHLLKDINLFMAAANASGVSTDSVEGIQRVLTQAVQMALGDADYSALFSAVVSQGQDHANPS
jgi:3-hydroxyisobutyrate dehydrogenase